MNFFSHCLVASKGSDDPKVWLGAMLPDFFGMASIPRPEVLQPALQHGIALHHLTDRVFHQDDSFLAMLREGASMLRELGVRRGPARALAHVAIELHLDGLLSVDESAIQAMEQALKVSLADALNYRHPDHESSLLKLINRVASRMQPTQYRDTALVQHRLVRIMSRRPRLALLPSEEKALESVADHLRKLVHRQGNDLRDRVCTAVLR